MGAAAHLGIKPGGYDKTIATLIPHYLELIDSAAAAVGWSLARRRRSSIWAPDRARSRSGS